jgi:WD40 repeat protein
VIHLDKTDGRLCSASSDKTIGIWFPSHTDIRDKKAIVNYQPFVQLPGHKGGVTSLASLVDGTLVSASVDKSIKFWDTHTIDTQQMCLHTIDNAHDNVIICMIATPGLFSLFSLFLGVCVVSSLFVVVFLLLLCVSFLCFRFLLCFSFFVLFFLSSHLFR